MSRSERERTNHTLLNRLLLEHGTEVLRGVFERERPPGNLRDYLASAEFQRTLISLHHAGHITLRQRRRLEAPPFPESSADFDISLLAALLRNICGLRHPSHCVWSPHENWDDTLEVNIARLREYKNEFVSHVTSASLDDATFEEHWGKISGTIIALAGRQKERYASAISQLKSSQRFAEVKQKLEHLEGMLVVIPMSYGSS